MTIRVAIIGAGIMGGDHARIIAEDIPGATLQVVCDVSEDAARRVADANGAADVGVEAEAAIRRTDVDAVLIASPDGTHAALTLTALSLQKPVLCEKPLALSPAACQEVIDAECAIGRQLVQVGFMRRFDPAYVAMKATLTAGRIGQPVMMHNLHRNVAAPAGFSGPMAITNSAPHEFDAARYVLGAEVTAISAFAPKLNLGAAAAPVVMVMETAPGQLVTVEINNDAAYGYDVRGELVGTKGAVSLSAPATVQLDADLTSAAAYADDWRPRFAEAYRLQNKAWIHAIATGVPAPGAANAWDGYCASVIAAAGVKALSSGQKVNVGMGLRPQLYATSKAAA